MVEESGKNVVPSNKTNIFIATFTTSYARLKLYEAYRKKGREEDKEDAKKMA